MNKKLARISSASLNMNREILKFWINVDYEDGCSQGIGGITLDTYDEVQKKRIGSVYGCEMIRRLLMLMKVNDFSEMKDKLIWVIGEGEDFSFEPRGIQRLNLDGGEKFMFVDIFYLIQEQG